MRLSLSSALSESILSGATSAVSPPPLPFRWTTPSRAVKPNQELAAANGCGARGDSEGVLKEQTVAAGRGVPDSA